MMRKTNIRRAWTASSALLLTFALAACDSGGNDANDTTAPESSAPEATASGQDGKQTVTVAVFTEDRFLEEAVAKFEQAHPDIDIEIQETVPTDTSGNQMSVIKKAGEDDGAAQADIDKYVNAVGTALMSGNAADLISVKYLPVDRYLDKGMFADWSEAVGKDSGFQTADYYERVLKGMTDGTSWYAIPVNYSVEALIGNKAAIEQAGGADDATWTWEQFIALCQKIASATQADGSKLQAVSGVKPTQAIGYLAQSLYGKLVIKEGKSYSFDEEAFRGYLEQVKRLFDSGAASTEGLGMSNQAFMTTTFSALMDLAMLPSQLGNGQGEVLSPPGSGQDEGLPYSSDLAFALNDKSKAKEAAWEFVKFLLSEEIQATPSMMAIPVHQAAAKTKLTQFAEDLQSGRGKVMIKNGDQGAAQPLSITDEQIESALALLPSVGKYNRKDDKVIDIIAEESDAYFSGSKQAEAVAKAVAGRVETYLNE